MNSLHTMEQPRLIVSGLCGGSGKTLLSLGLVRAFTERSYKVKPYKKGPDYIDAAWLGLAAGRPATNLDLFFLSADRTRDLFFHALNNADLAVIEGNRGLFDGRDLAGSYSTAALANTLSTPVLLALNCTKMTRTAAAIVLGLINFTPRINLAGVVLNNTATSRHAALVRRSIEEYTPVPVLGALPRLVANPIPERHMGLTAFPLFQSSQHTNTASNSAEAALNTLAALAKDNVDLDKVLAIAKTAGPLPAPCAPFWPDASAVESTAPKPHIAYVRDAALWFYYPENLEALERAGARLCEVSLLDHAPWPEIDGLYLGGGFPEDSAEKLSASPHLAAIKKFSMAGMPIYAECGGFMLLCNTLEYFDKSYPMAGIFPGRTVFHAKPKGLGYVEAVVCASNPYHTMGSTLRGHEFHFSGYEPNAETRHILKLEHGTGMGQGRDGLLAGNTYAAYTHIFAPNVPQWAKNFVSIAEKYSASTPT